MNTYLYRGKKIKSIFSKETNTFRVLAGKKLFDAGTTPVPFLKINKILHFIGSDVTMARIVQTAEHTSWPLPPGIFFYSVQGLQLEGLVHV